MSRAVGKNFIEEVLMKIFHSFMIPRTHIISECDRTIKKKKIFNKGHPNEQTYEIRSKPIRLFKRFESQLSDCHSLVMITYKSSID